MAIIKVINDNFLKEFRNLIESQNINFLIGAGFSANVLHPLGNMEQIMKIIKENTGRDEYIILEAIMYWTFFEVSIYPMLGLINRENLSEQIEFLNIWSEILHKRHSAILQKQINIFTTNYDVILEYAMESSFIEYNDGFTGRINPFFTTENYNKLYYKQAIFTNQKSEMPIFNLFKIHGSITWKEDIDLIEQNRYGYGNYTVELDEFYKEGLKILFKDIESQRTAYKLTSKLKEFENVKQSDIDNELSKVTIDSLFDKKQCRKFIDFYKKRFKIVSPTKEKFSDTIVNKNYYELCRIYCNELERQGSLLIVYGFSFYDEHFRDITKRALNNPSLLIIIIPFTKENAIEFNRMFDKFRNVWILHHRHWDTAIGFSDDFCESVYVDNGKDTVDVGLMRNEERIYLESLNKQLTKLNTGDF